MVAVESISSLRSTTSSFIFATIILSDSVLLAFSVVTLTALFNSAIALSIADCCTGRGSSSVGFALLVKGILISYIVSLSSAPLWRYIQAYICKAPLQKYSSGISTNLSLPICVLDSPLSLFEKCTSNTCGKFKSAKYKYCLRLYWYCDLEVTWCLPLKYM